MNWSAFDGAGAVVMLHMYAAFAALLVGTVMLLRKKGTGSHKIIGRVFLCLMLFTAISSFWIREINDGGLSWIHIFIPITLFASWEAVYYIRKGQIRQHKRAVLGMFFGALLIPGLFTLMPGRRLWLFFFGG